MATAKLDPVAWQSHYCSKSQRERCDLNKLCAADLRAGRMFFSGGAEGQRRAACHHYQTCRKWRVTHELMEGEEGEKL